jgi:crotonobetainyl-CoA:carnitine CoA-transferase CaiB-like acyl-CoA transferase
MNRVRHEELENPMLLTGCTALDLAGPLGSLTGRILADLGVDVIKVEPPGGDRARHAPPVLGVEGHPPQSLGWMVLNANKRSVTLDLESPGGRDRLLDLAGSVDFLIESFEPGHLDRLGLGFERLRAHNPRLILVSITPFGQKGPYAHWLASDLEIMALSGALSLAGDADGEPMRCTAPQAAMWVGAEAAMGALTALAARGITGRGQHVDVSAQAAMTSALAHAPAFVDVLGVVPRRAGIYITGRSTKGAKMRAFWACRDGWINFVIYGGAAGRRTNEQLVAWMASRDMAPDWLKAIDWSRFDATLLDQADVDRLEAPIAGFLLTLTKQEFFTGAVEREMLGYPVFTVADIHADPQLEARAFWSTVRDGTTGTALRLPGGFAIVDGTRLPIRRGPPAIGEHNADILPPVAARGLQPPPRRA